jgi:hypothetical protein
MTHHFVVFEHVSHPPCNSFSQHMHLIFWKKKAANEIQIYSAAYVQGRKNFRSDGRNANLGKYSFGFMWAAVACLLLSTILFCVGGAASSSRRTRKTTTNGQTHNVQNPARIKFFQRKDKTRNRESYIDSVDQRKQGYV